jgi:hypothetical protein
MKTKFLLALPLLLSTLVQVQAADNDLKSYVSGGLTYAIYKADIETTPKVDFGLSLGDQKISGFKIATGILKELENGGLRGEIELGLNEGANDYHITKNKKDRQITEFDLTTRTLLANLYYYRI